MSKSKIFILLHRNFKINLTFLENLYDSFFILGFGKKTEKKYY